MSVPGSNSTHVDRRRRAHALLAGGLVLGLGAAGTLAAWSDSEFATGVFSSGQFNVQGNESKVSTTAGTWTDHFTSAVGTAAPLQFSANFDKLSPATTVYAPFSLRIDPAKASYGATVHIASAASTGDANLISKLTWKARTGIDPATCNAGTFTGGTPLVPSPDGTGVSVNYTAPTTPTSFALSNANAPAATPAVTVCFAVTMATQPANTNPNDLAWTFTGPVTTTWGFAAVSNP